MSLAKRMHFLQDMLSNDHHYACRSNKSLSLGYV